MTLYTSCPIRNGLFENLIHHLKKSSKARVVWNSLKVLSNIRSTFNLDLERWIAANIQCQSLNHQGLEYLF